MRREEEEGVVQRCVSGRNRCGPTAGDCRQCGIYDSSTKAFGKQRAVLKGRQVWGKGHHSRWLCTM
jgi:hypothetical protein